MSGLSDFELLGDPIGCGGQTVVYRGHDMNLNRPVAIKRLADQFQSDSRKRERFVRQAQFLAEFSHPHLVQVFSLEAKEGWIVMELMRGSLENCVGDARLSPSDARLILRQALQALDYIHGRGKIHGLIRPSNVLFDGNDRVTKLSDFEDIDYEAGVRVRPGEAKYLAPELLDPNEFGEIGPRLDLYCLAFTILEAMSDSGFAKRVAGIGAATEAEAGWMRWHSSPDPYPAATEIVPGLPTDIAALLDQSLQKQVGARPTSAEGAKALLDEQAAIAAHELEIVDSLPGNLSSSAATSPLKGASEWNESTPTPTMIGEPAPSEQPAASPASVSSGEGSDPSTPGEPKLAGKDFLGKRVLYPVAGAVLTLAAVAGLFIPTGNSGPEQAGVVVTTDPVGIEFLIDDKPANVEKSKGAKQLLLMEPGKHVFTGELANYETVTKSLEIKPGRNEIEFALPVRKGTVAVSVEPAEAEIIVDTVPVSIESGSGELSLPYGKHTLEVSAAGFETQVQEIDVGSENKPLVLSLEPETVAVSFITQPEDAKVKVNEEVFEASRGTVKTELPVGRQVVFVSRDGCKEEVREIQIARGGDNQFKFELPIAVRIETTPADAVVSKAGTRLEADMIDLGTYYLSPGRHEITASKAGYLATTKTLEVSLDGTNELKFSLKRDGTAKAEEMKSTAPNPGEVARKDGLRVLINAPGGKSGKVLTGGREYRVRDGVAFIPRGDLDENADSFHFSVELDSGKNFRQSVPASGALGEGTITLQHSVTKADDARFTWLFARQAIRSRTADVAENQLTKAIEIDEENAQYQFFRDRAIARATQGKTNLAKRDFETAKSMPGGAQDFYLLQEYAILLASLGNAEACARACDEALRLRNHATGPRLLRAQLAFRSQNYQAALDDATRLWEESYDREQLSYAKNLVGLVLLKRNEAEKALDSFRHAVNLDPSNSSAHLNVGKTARAIAINSQGDERSTMLQLARSAYATALKIDPNLEEQILSLVAQIEYDAGDARAAIDTLTNLMQKYGPTAVRLQRRSALYKSIGMNDEAVKDEVRAGDLN